MRAKRVLIPALVAALLAAPAPAAAQISAQEREQGAAYRAQILEQFGGSYTGHGYAEVQRVGRAIAVQSGLSRDGSDCTVTLLNSTIVNAFATPGCYIYTTRGMLGIIDDEAELASVLGHEIGHVAARHAEKRETRSAWAGLGAALANMLTGSQTVTRIAAGLGQRALLGYSRDQEYEADSLGVRYMTRAGYSPYESARMLQALAANDAFQVRVTGQDPGAKIPSWARSHPLTQDRIARATALARATGAKPGQGRVGYADYLANIDGMLWGDDPEQGFIDGRTFAHPLLRIAFTAPPGFVLTNSPAAVAITGGDGRAVFGGGRLAPDEELDHYVARVARTVVGGATVQTGDGQRATINGIESAMLPLRANAAQGQVDVTIAAYRAGPSAAYHFIMLTPPGGGRVFAQMVNSFRPLSSDEVTGLRPRVIRVVTLGAHDTLGVMAAQMAFTNLRAERFLALNGLTAARPLYVGQRVKLIVYARP